MNYLNEQVRVWEEVDRLCRPYDRMDCIFGILRERHAHLSLLFSLFSLGPWKAMEKQQRLLHAAGEGRSWAVTSEVEDEEPPRRRPPEQMACSDGIPRCSTHSQRHRESPGHFFVNVCYCAEGFSINCGSKNAENIGGIEWITDDSFVKVGNATDLNIPGIVPVLSSLRYFPDKSARKYCYVIPAAKGAKYLIRTTYFYGGFDGGNEPPVFDQIVGGTKWSTVDTSENYAKGLASYYEIIMASPGKTLSVCLARNEQTMSSPFISALEVQHLERSMYNSTDFAMYALSTVARHRFGHGGQITSYPDDPFNRYWEPFVDANPVVKSQTNVTSFEFWNLPPAMAFLKALTTSRGKNLTIQWPTVPLPNASYYLALYFQDNRSPSPFSWRVFDVSVNGKTFYSGLNVSTGGVVVVGNNWPLSGLTEIRLTPAVGSPVGPVINAGELSMVVPLGGRTLTRDVIAMEALARSFDNPPSDWSGDPCLPRQNAWTGVTCSGGKIMRVVSL
ncbi:hypothetical protein BHM03_00003079 [Ensete ventricosum]|nr:hypothetical protein BHM03_00003079 [Ensete ventricosum]